jgi:hypothetical protein
MNEDKADNTDKGPEGENQRRIPRPGEWSEVMDELFEEAMRDGAFEDLPGWGKPLKLSRNPFAPEEELAYQLLKDNNYTLPWIAERNEAYSLIERFREEVGPAWRRYQAEYRVAQGETIRMSLSLGWREQLARWQEQIDKLNRLIAQANLKQPANQLEILKLDLKGELARAGASEELE